MKFILRTVPTISVCLLAVACKKQEITYYEVPREDMTAGEFAMPGVQPPPAQPEQSTNQGVIPEGAPPAGNIPVAVEQTSGSGVRFGLPAIPRSWHEDDGAGGARLASYHVHGPRSGEAHVGIIGFPVDAGSNEDFARFESNALQLPAASGEQITLGDHDVYWIDLTSEQPLINNRLRKGIISGIIRHSTGVLLVRMEGDADTISAERENFRRFVSGIVIDTGASSSPAPQTASTNLPPSSNSMAGQTLPSAVLSHAASPDWEVPAEWQPGVESTMRRGSFTVPSSGGLALDISVQVFPGEVGGLLLNINRWRQQVGLEPVAASELGSITESGPVGNMTGTWSTLKGPQEETVVAIVMHDSNSWFFKMTGHLPLVEQERERFREFVASVRFE